ncbi:hypothetical protein TR51_28610 [Kitasatospora griseola]|uniref:N-acetyltransferase domain-containing protein n=1 Tax=Kitasatospora griseola TaxID=2064 RepID=A0A0D0NUK0_KITGR|nr:hypothetical protein TR51_28610 [Kitasatospora griseola]
MLDHVDGLPDRHAKSLHSADAIVVRRFSPHDSAVTLTRMLHHAYSDHAAAGRVFFASYQSVEDTTHRLGAGECWIASEGSKLVGTVTLAAPFLHPKGYPAPSGAGSFWQLAVAPSQQETGLGQRLLGVAESRVAALGALKW